MTIKKTYCDICGEEILGERYDVKIFVDTYTKQYPRICKDLCEDCLEKMFEFFKTSKADNGVDVNILTGEGFEI